MISRRLTQAEADAIAVRRAAGETWGSIARDLGRNETSLIRRFKDLAAGRQRTDATAEQRRGASITNGQAYQPREYSPPIGHTDIVNRAPGIVTGSSTHGCRVAAARPVGGGPRRVRVAHVTDIHFGSKHCDANALLRFLRLAADAGCEAVMCTGDVLDGFSEKLMHEQRAIGLDDQAKEAVEVLRQGPRLPWWAISGNHDGYFRDHVGADAGVILAERMRAGGIEWHYAGSCYGRVTYAGARIELYHPHGGGATRNAVRRVLNAKVERYEPSDRPHVLLGGHFHKFAAVHAYPENVLCVGGGTFQVRESDFGVRMIHPWDVGGGIISWTLSAEGVASEFAAELHNVRPEARGWAA